MSAVTFTASETTTTLARIRAASPCKDDLEILLKGLGKTSAKDDTEPLPLARIMEISPFDVVLLVLSHAMPSDRLARHFQARCAERVLHLFEREFPGDMSVRNQIAALRNDDLSEAARDAARAAAWASATASSWDAAWSVARAAARAAQKEQLSKMIGA